MRGERFPVVAKFVGGVLLAATGCACAMDGNPLTVFAAAGASHDSNVFRIAPDTDLAPVLGTSARGDNIRTLTGGVELDKTWGQQRLRSHLSGSRVGFARFSFLDYDALEGDARWLWRLGSRLDGELGISGDRRLADFSDFRTPERNIRTQRSRFLRGGWDATPGWRLSGGLRVTDTDTTQAATRTTTLHEQAAEAALHFTTRPGNRLGVAVVRAEGRYDAPQFVLGQPVDNAYEQVDLSGVVEWRPNGKSELLLRAGVTERKQEQLPQRNFRGPTGNLTYHWNTSGKFAASFILRRELSTYQDLVTNYTVNRSAAVAPVWSLTGKTALRANYEYRLRDYQGDPGIVIANAPQRHDRLRTAAITLQYDDQRHLKIGLTLQRETRASNQPGADFRADAATLSAQAAF